LILGIYAGGAVLWPPEVLKIMGVEQKKSLTVKSDENKMFHTL